MRTLTSHKVNGLNEAIEVFAYDERGVGNANHLYILEWITPHEVEGISKVTNSITVKFQEGPIGEMGVNGISNEALLAIVEDRLLGFQSSQFSCRENALALTHLQEAMMWLQKRTRDRMERGVEGTNKQ